MSELKPGDRVLTVLEMVVVKPSLNPVMIFGAKDIRPGENAWKLPFDDATVERLAEAAFRGYWGDCVSNGMAAWDAPQRQEDTREDWRRTVRAVIAELIGDTP